MNEQEYRALHKARWSSHDPARGPMQQARLEQELHKAKREFTRDIYRQRGWTLKKQSFAITYLQLRPSDLAPRECHWCIDHHDYFLERSRPVAILTHGYAPWPEMVKYAAEIGLKVERLPFSWHNPDKTTAAIFSGYRFAPGVNSQDVELLELEDLIALGLAV